MRGERERQVTFFTGSVATEALVGIDEEAMRLAYTVTDGPLHADHYNASAQVIPQTPQQCLFVWTVDILPDELAGMTAQLMDAGLRAITATLSSNAA
jgi:hypothetical protein